jgi:hypothetical protein
MVEKQMPENPYAFPVSTIDGFTTDGMTLRDWFAGQALVGGLSAADGDNFGTAETAAKQAYEIADAMLLARTQSLPNTHADGGR